MGTECLRLRHGHRKQGDEVAQIPANLRDKAEAAGESWGQFKLLAPGLYAARLEEVDTQRDPGPAGDYWAWIFNYENQPGKAFLNTSFSEKAIGSVGAVFRAFDAPIDEDTDNLVGELCILSVSVGKVKKGPRKGQLRNEVSAVLPWEDGFTDVVQGEIPDASELADGDEEEAPAGRANGAAKKSAGSGGGRRRSTAATAGGKPEDWE